MLVEQIVEQSGPCRRREEAPECNGAHDPACFAKREELLVRLVARVVDELARVRVGEQDRTRRCLDRVDRRSRTAMGQVDGDSPGVEFADDVLAEQGQARVHELQAAAADRVLGHVGGLHDPDAQSSKLLDERDLVLEWGPVLEAVDQPHTALARGSSDVVRRPDMAHDVLVLCDQSIPHRESARRLGVVLVDGERHVCRRDSGIAHPEKARAGRDARVDAIDHDRRCVEVARVHRRRRARYPVLATPGLRPSSTLARGDAGGGSRGAGPG